MYWINRIHTLQTAPLSGIHSNEEVQISLGFVFFFFFFFFFDGFKQGRFRYSLFGGS